MIWVVYQIGIPEFKYHYTGKHVCCFHRPAIPVSNLSMDEIRCLVPMALSFSNLLVDEIRCLLVPVVMFFSKYLGVRD